MQGKTDYQEKLFAQFQLSERIPKTNFYRQLREVLAMAYNLKKHLKFMEKHGKSGAASLRFVFYRFKAAIEAILSPYGHLEIRP